MCSRAEDLRYFALYQLARAGFFHLVADCDFSAGLQQPTNVAVGGVKWNAAHRDGAPFGQSHI